MTTRSLNALAALLLALACADTPFAPPREVLNLTPPSLASVAVHHSAYGPELFRLSAVADPAFPLLVPGEYTEIRVRSNAGEDELLRLRPTVCGESMCRLFTLRVPDLAQTSAYRDTVLALGGVLERGGQDLIPFEGVFAVREPELFRRRLLRIPGILDIERVVAHPSLDLVGLPPPGAPFRANLEAAAFFTVGAPVSRDGIITGLTGDSISVEYWQPGALAPQAWGFVLN